MAQYRAGATDILAGRDNVLSEVFSENDMVRLDLLDELLEAVRIILEQASFPADEGGCFLFLGADWSCV